MRTFDATSSKVINAISPLLTQRIPLATANNLSDIGDFILSNQDLTNQFLNVLMNRIAFVWIHDRIYNNPLRPFRQGTLKYGDIIEEVYVAIAEAHEYDPQVAESELYKRVIPDVGTYFHKMNSQLFYKVTISNEQLAKAFTSEDGMRQLIAVIVDSLYNGANYDEFLQMKNLFSVSKNEFFRIRTDAPAVATASNIVTNFKSASNLLQFMSDNYNRVAVKNYTPRGNQVLFLRADVDAIIDVNVLAAAFNMDKAEFLGRKILVDDFGVGNDDIYAVLCDDEFLVCRNNLEKFTEQYNAQSMTWNYFYHVWNTYSVSPFSNAIAFTTAAITAVTGVAIDQASTSAAAGANVQMTATITPSGASVKNVKWSLGGSPVTGTYISSTGFLHIGEHQSADFTVTATSMADSTKAATVTWSNGAFGANS